MIGRYRCIKQYCQEHEWAAALSAISLLVTIGAAIYLLLEFQVSLLHWLNSDILINGLIMFAIGLLILAIALPVLCLSFSPCSIEERTERVIHRHQPVMAGSLKLIKNLGVNPKRRRKLVRTSSA
jgi:hypothetical protein